MKALVMVRGFEREKEKEGREKSRTSVEHINTNDLGLESRTKSVFKH